jgi:hypothetical protein
MTWYQDLQPRGKNKVTISTTISRDRAKELDKVGDYLLAKGMIKKNTSYRCSQYAIDLLIQLVSEQIKHGT